MRKSKLLDLQLKEQELLVKYKEDSPPVKDVRKADPDDEATFSTPRKRT